CALWNPAGIAVDGASLWVADQLNQRILRFTTLTNGAAASDIIGQSCVFDSTDIGTASRPPFCACPAGLSCVNGVRYANYYDNALANTNASSVSYPDGLGMDTSAGSGGPNRRL